jgi:hypothetical protein
MSFDTYKGEPSNADQSDYEVFMAGLDTAELDELAKKLDPEMDREQITNALKDLLGDEDSFKQFFAAVEEQGKKVANEELAKFQDANPSEAVSSNAETQDNKADLQVEFEHGMTRHDLSKIVNWLEPTS